ncbi:MAG TPA: alkaline phosphatase family protein [Gemmatimonadaceae bacterium]|nr:alkaline phosphatase family protein [Gemmatimonadaceae bacterium]
MKERRSHPRAGPLLRFYYRAKYRLFRREKRPHDGRRGVIALQVDALAYADLRRAIERGYCPTIKRLLEEGDFELRRWFCGLPSATPYCQAGIFHGSNEGIPAFRFYDKPARKLVTCNLPEGVQYIRDRIDSPGALAGGSSYVNLLDGDASTVAFTVATREKISVYQRLGGGRMAMLILLHPIRVARMIVQSAFEYVLEEYERLVGEISRRVTHSEGIFPFIRILSNVIIRELQTMAILLDVYLGVPVIYSTFMQYDELAHHFGPSSKQALADLKRTDARINEIWRMARLAGGRQYDLVILSDHGMTPARSYRVRFGETLGATVEHMLDGEVYSSHSERSEYADIAPEVVEAVATITPETQPRTRRTLRRVRDWLRSRYGLREIIIPEKFRVASHHDVVVTYSSCLALVYFAEDAKRLMHEEILADARRRDLYHGLLAHEGIGLVATLTPEGVHVEGKQGRGLINDASMRVTAGRNPMDAYGTETYVLRAVESLVRQPNAGDCVLFGAYDGYDIVSFDDQVGAHGSAGGDQVYPFLITPSWLNAAGETLEDARDIHRAVLLKYSEGQSPR